MHKPRSWTASLIALIWLATVAGVASAGPQKSLYERLGGYDAVAAVVDDFLGRMIADKQLGRFFAGLGDDRKHRARQLTVDFVCEATGGPCYYTGRDMKTTHKGMGITAADWNLAVGHLKATLAKFKVPAQEQKEVLDLIGGLRDQVVDQAP